ncbi:MAG: sigma-70 family RNA polymerase sigma factor [Planctomycetaceae bacterium]|jgi:RNA polymerase sigma factor (sigma-70 family)
MSDCSHHSSVTDWVLAESRGLDASRQLWERYLSDVVRACEVRLTRNQRRSLSGEDLAQEVFHDFFLGLRTNAFSRLKNRRDVQQILAMLVERTAIDCRRRHQSTKAGAGRVQVFSELDSGEPDGLSGLLRSPSVLSQDPRDEAELRQLLLALVPDMTDPKLQNIVCDRIMGCTIEEISERNQISEHAVLRKLRLLIRKLRSGSARNS